MAHSYRSTYVHLIFRVRGCCFLQQDLPDVHAYMRTVMDHAGCKSITIGGTTDHVHILAELPFDKSGDTIRITKTSTTKWLKRRNPDAYMDFSWIGGSGYFNVSYTLVPNVVEYIANQEKHHEKISADDEFQRFLRRYDIEYHPEWE